MAGIKELKTRIKSIGSTRKITRAMQMVSAAKMRKAQNATLQSRNYASLAWEMIESLSPNSVIARSAADEAISSDAEKIASDALAMTNLLRAYPDAKKVGVILLSSNRGLVGSLNTNLMGKMKEIDMTNRSPVPVADSGTGQADGGNGTETIAELITYGKKGQIIAAKLKKDIVADFPKFDRTISVEDIYPIAKFISDAYASGKYKKIVIVYNHFVSTLSQKPTVKQLLPFRRSDEALAKSDDAERSQPIHRLSEKEPINGLTTSDDTGVIFEPTPQAVINHLIPRIIESQIYQAILESDASEQSARMVMMKNATEAAGDLISDLTLTFNQLRQNKITTELAEITAGKIALE